MESKVLFNAVLTTAQETKSKIILDNAKSLNKILPFQKVIKVGAMVQEIKEGDIVLLETSRYKEPPYITIGDVDYLLVTDRDIKLIFEGEDIPKEFKE